MYDVVVVGARCAGASIAMLLARQGHRILMIDKDSRGTDMAHSTHFVQPIAVSKLRKWGCCQRWKQYVPRSILTL